MTCSAVGGGTDTVLPPNARNLLQQFRASDRVCAAWIHGFVGASYLSPVLRSWLAGAEASGPTIGGFLHVTLASVAAGLTVSTVRWATIDRIHHRTGLPQPAWDFSRLQAHFAAYKMLNEIHYKFYQFYSNALISLLFVFVARRIHLGFFTAAFGWLDAGFLLLAPILYIGSRNTLRNYYERVSDLLDAEQVKR